jgi:hypothetical protein
MMADIEEELLMAHVDGELDPQTATRVARALETDLDLRAQADSQRRLRERLAGHYGPVADEEIPARLRAMLESNVVALPTSRPERRFGRRAWAAMAASFVVGLVAVQMIPDGGGPAGVTGERMVASGALARALDTQLVSEQSTSAPTRIGLSFAAKDGRICRTFENGAMAGLACRQGESWHLVAHQSAPPGPDAEYRQAASETGAVMRLSQELMKGEPFDAQAEREARDKGWVSRR